MQPIVEARYESTRGVLRVSDGYLLFASLKRAGLVRNAEPDLQIQGDGRRVLIRASRERIQSLACLEGRTLDVDGMPIEFGPAVVASIVPAERLNSWLVTIKGKIEPDDIRDAIRRQLNLIGVGTCRVVVGRRGAVRVAGSLIVGYGVEIHDLADADSILVQSRGVGGRLRFGCGVFAPV